MTRGQRTLHRLIWTVLIPLSAIAVIVAIALRPGAVAPLPLPIPPGATP